MKDFDSTPINKLSNTDAMYYFRESQHYVSFDLPPYFDFNDILISSHATLAGKKLTDICIKKNGKPVLPCNFPGVNYVVLSNKDGSFAWRPLEIIHPILYMDIVNLITEKISWNEIKKFFIRRDRSVVCCIGMPLKSNTPESNRAASVSNWWDKIEQESLRKSLDFKFIFHTDISNCYPSIYTHSFEWAMHKGGRLGVKEARKNGEKVENLGTNIDRKVRNMTQGQTIGIPQGSVLMDFLAEIVLGGTDIELTKQIKLAGIDEKSFMILRYRDDYRILSNEYQVGHEIMKILNNVLYAWNMKMNSIKTKEANDLILSAVKEEKLDEIYIGAKAYTFQKQAMRIYILSKKYPNAGLIAKNLTEYYDNLDDYEERLRSDKVKREFDYEVVIAIIAMIAYYSPRYIPQVSAIITRIIEFSKKTDRLDTVRRIVKKFDDVPNTEFIDIWLQRITDSSDIKKHSFGSRITKVATGKRDNSYLWNSDWLNILDRNQLNQVRVSTLSEDVKEGKFNPIVERDEFELYRVDYD